MQEATCFWKDKQGCIKLALTERINPHTKYIDVKYHILRDSQEKGITELK